MIALNEMLNNFGPKTKRLSTTTYILVALLFLLEIGVATIFIIEKQGVYIIGSGIFLSLILISLSAYGYAIKVEYSNISRLGSMRVWGLVV